MICAHLHGSESSVVGQEGIVEDGALHEHDHVLLPDEPVDQVDERGNDGGVSDFLDHQHREGRLVPGQPLGGRILNCPDQREKTALINQLTEHEIKKKTMPDEKMLKGEVKKVVWGRKELAEHFQTFLFIINL